MTANSLSNLFWHIFLDAQVLDPVFDHVIQFGQDLHSVIEFVLAFETAVGFQRGNQGFGSFLICRLWQGQRDGSGHPQIRVDYSLLTVRHCFVEDPESGLPKRNKNGLQLLMMVFSDLHEKRSFKVFRRNVLE